MNTEAIRTNPKILQPQGAQAGLDPLATNPDRSPAARIEGARGGASAQARAQHDGAESNLRPTLELAQNVAEQFDRKLQFYKDEGTGRLAAMVVDRGSGKVIRYIPPQELLKLAARIEEVAATLRGDQVPVAPEDARIA